tara:strand:- start:147 stop:398 length:252 start_codon:yes stop_codon:yes gene_type:complete
MGNMLHEYFRDEKKLEQFIENHLKEQDQTIMKLAQQKRLISSALTSLSALLNAFNNEHHRQLIETRDILTEWLKEIDRQLDVI